MSLEPLKTNSLYVLLFGRGDPPFQPDYFHWALYIHREQDQKQQQQNASSNSNSNGTLHHAVCPQETWFTKHEPLHNILNAEGFVSALRIADIPSGLEDHVDRTLKSYDSSLGEISNISCMVWAFQILELLQEKGESIPSTILNCSDLDALQKEVADWGNEVVTRTVAEDASPNPVIRASSLCGLE